MKDAVLDVVAVISNPFRYRSRYQLYRQFEKEMLAQPNVRLTTVEAAFGDRPHEITQAGNARHLQVRTGHSAWQKESMINLGISTLPKDWQYVAWIDADVSFTRPDWALETIQQLQHHDIVQMFSHALDMGPNHEVLEKHMGFGYGHVKGMPVNHGGGPYAFWHPGFAWSARRSFIEQVGGLMDWTLLGAADHIMACAILGKLPLPVRLEKDCPNYIVLAKEWMKQAAQIKGNLGYVPTTLLHTFHGAKKNRKYVERWQILFQNQYDPLRDIKHDWQGLIALSGNKPKLRDELNAYFLVRNEDSTDAE